MTDSKTTSTNRKIIAENAIDEIEGELSDEREKLVLRKQILFVVGILGLISFFLLGLSVGGGNVRFAQVMPTLWQAITEPNTANLTPQELLARNVVVELRLPRILLALTAGAALSIGGVILQGLLRNPLVSPFTLGLSPAAAFGAAAVIFFVPGVTTGNPLVAVGAFVSTFVVAGLVLTLSSKRKADATILVLVGMALTQLFGALTSSLQYIAKEETLAAIVRWTFGTVNNATWSEVGIVSLLLLIFLPMTLLRASSLNAVAFAGDDVAQSLGVNVRSLRTVLIIIAVILTSVVISLTGVIGFVGLVGPHIARLIIGADHRHLLPFSILSGGLLLLIADTLGRTLFPPAVIPVGITVALVGAPLFLHLILARKRSFL